MALVEDVIATDPVLKRVFFDPRRFAPRSDQVAGKVAGLDMAISEDKVKFQKASSPALAEYWQRKMRGRWFAIRKLCDGYYMKLPAGHDDGCEHVTVFEHDADSRAFAIDTRERAAYWYKYAQREPPSWNHHSCAAWAARGPRRRRRH